MNDLLDNPAVQAGVAPFLVALVLAVLLWRRALLGLAIGAALATVAALALGFSFDSLTAARKMVLVGLGASVLVLPLELAAIPPRWQLRATLAGAAALAGVWMLWRVLHRMDLAPALLAGLAAAAYVAALVESTFAVRNDPVQSASAALILGLASGVLFTKKEMCGADAVTVVKRSDFGMKTFVGPVADDIKMSFNIEAYRE